VIIGITGTIGAGKGTIVDYLVKKYHFKHLSVRGFLTAIIAQKNLPLNRDSMVMVANELRANHSPSYIAEQLFLEAKKTTENCIIESIRTIGEVTALREKGDFILLAVDAEPKLRFDRVVLRGSETDKIDFATFLDNEAREMNSDDPNKQNLAACQKMADYNFSNNDSFENLYQQIDTALSPLFSTIKN
jgi:dephospho-CoA kinase